MATRDYAGTGITVHWDAEICEHAAECVRGAPEVFDTARRPWIAPGVAPAEEIAAVIDRCPSQALTYSRTDGGPLGPNGVAVDAPASRASAPAESEPRPGEDSPRIELREDGPLVVTGPVTLDDGSGQVSVERVFLCRCGASGDKPRCDGSHKRIGFRATGVPVPRKP